MTFPGDSQSDDVDDIGMFHPLLYVILVEGTIEPAWSERLSGMTVTVHATAEGPRTTLAGVLVVQAALQGVLKLVYDLGLPVLAVTRA